MTDAALNERDDRGNWRPAEPIALAPINAWPPRPVAVVKWLFGFPGYIWPYLLFWLGVTLITWACPSSKHLGHVILFPMGGSGSSRFDDGHAGATNSLGRYRLLALDHRSDRASCKSHR